MPDLKFHGLTIKVGNAGVVEFDGGLRAFDDATFHLACYRYPPFREVIRAGSIKEGIDNPKLRYEGWEHLAEAMRLLLAGKFQWHWGCDFMCKRSEEFKSVCVVGHTRLSKSYFYGCESVIDWLAAPKETLGFFYSTNVESLTGRVWKGVSETWAHIERTRPDMAGLASLKRRPNRLEPEESGNEYGLRCIAIPEGSSAEDLNDKIGMHASRLRLNGDEIQGLPQFILNMEDNLGSAASFKQRVWGNYQDGYNALSLASEPPEGIEWWRKQSILHKEAGFLPDAPMEPIEWMNALNFHVMWFPGYRSPSALHPDGPEAGEREIPHILSLKRIRELENKALATRKWYGFYKNAVAGPMPQGDIQRVLSSSDQDRYGVTASVTWGSGYKAFYGCDGGSGSDATVVVKWGAGRDKDGAFVVAILDEQEFVVEEGSKELVTAQTVKQLKGYFKKEKAKKSQIFAEGGGLLNGLWDMLDLLWEESKDKPGKINRIKPNGEKPKFRVSDFEKASCSDFYFGMQDYLWMQFQEWAEKGQLRGVTPQIAYELDLRKVYDESDPVRIQEKQHKGKAPLSKFESLRKEMESQKSPRGHSSPNCTDAAAVGLHGIRMSLGVWPGSDTAKVDMAMARDDDEAPKRRVSRMAGSRKRMRRLYLK